VKSGKATSRCLWQSTSRSTPRARCGESSGGLTIRGHIPGKNGIFASALAVEMLARASMT
jgi:phosphomannomutase